MKDLQRFTRLTTQPLVLVFFYENNCPACSTMQAILKVVEQRLGGRLPIVQLDMAQYTNVVKRYQITKFPVCLLFQRSVLRFRQTGLTPAKTILAQYYQCHPAD